MTLLEKDFSKFLSELGYSKSTSTNYPYYLKKFASENGYANLIDLADDVFSLLNKGKFDNRDFSKEKLSKIKKYKSVLTLFNSFLFDIDFKRRCFIHSSLLPRGCFGLLVTDQTYIPGVRPRTLKDDTDKNREWFSSVEVIQTLHLSYHVLQRWDKKTEEEKHKKCIPHKYKGPNKYGIDISVNVSDEQVCDYKYDYYILKELNDFLEHQFDYGKGAKREQYLSDVDIRKTSKKE